MSGDDEFDSIHPTHDGSRGEGFDQDGERDSRPRAAAPAATESRSADYPRRKKRSRSGGDISPEAKRRAAIALHNVKERQR